MKTTLITAAIMAAATLATAQPAAQDSIAKPAPQAEKHHGCGGGCRKNLINVHGFAMLGLQAVSQDSEHTSSFDISLARLSVDGTTVANRAGEFFYKAQIQVNGDVSDIGSSARLTDFFAEWRKFDFLHVTVGEFSIPFTLESPLHPLDVGFADNAVPILKLVGYSDRSGQRKSNGRDIGIDFEGDLFKMKDGHPFLHYALSIVNGQGINTRDKDSKKNIIFQANLSPVKPLKLSFSALEGSLARTGTWHDDAGRECTGDVQLDQHRYAVGAEWSAPYLTFRAEYIHSTGFAFAERENGSSTTDATIAPIGDKADGAYAMALVPILRETLPGRLRVKARWDLYRPSASMATAQTTTQLGVDYWFTQKIGAAVEYSHANDRSLDRHNYNYYDFQIQVRF